MTALYNPNYIQNLKAKLSTRSTKAQRFNFCIALETEDKSPDYAEYYFQLLLFNEDSYDFKLVYGTKKDLQKTFNFCESSLTLPTKGVKVDEKFFGIEDDRGIDPNDASYFALVRNLLQTRKLSQTMAYTWLDLDEQSNLPEGISKIQIQLVRRIFDTYNITPEAYWLEEDELESEDIEKKLIETKLKLKEKQQEYLLDFLIMPESISYNSVSLALLLCGQAYYKDQVEWKPIWQSIFGTPEVIREYALEINWDSFYGSIEEISRTKPQYPYNQAILGYPPRPDKFNLTQEKILDWATAKDKSSKGTQYPFYPDKKSEEWKNKNLKYVNPPFPYIPLSSS